MAEKILWRDDNWNAGRLIEKNRVLWYKMTHWGLSMKNVQRRAVWTDAGKSKNNERETEKLELLHAHTDGVWGTCWVSCKVHWEMVTGCYLERISLKWVEKE